MGQTRDETDFDDVAAGALATQVMVYGVGEALIEMGYLGYKLGIYAAMRDLGWTSPVETAQRAGLHERWVLEWLRSQTFAGLVTADGEGRFRLTATQAAVVADPASPFYRGTAWQNLERNTERRAALLEAFRTGVGRPTWSGRDPTEFPGMLEEFQRDTLVSAILPAVDGAIDALGAGGSFVDVGCGRGTALLEVAAAFPAARVHGWDRWSEALRFGQARASERGLANVEWHEADVVDLPSGAGFDVVLMADCVHHLADPAAALRAVHAALAPHGALIVIDFRVDQAAAQPLMAAGGYAASIRTCLHDGMPEGGGAGLGMLGFDEATARKLAAESGFQSFRTLPVEHWLNVAYELRP